VIKICQQQKRNKQKQDGISSVLERGLDGDDRDDDRLGLRLVLLLHLAALQRVPATKGTREGVVRERPAMGQREVQFHTQDSKRMCQ
jgi:hypothetical protein